MGNINCINIKCYISGYGARGGQANGQGNKGNGLLSTDVCTGHMTHTHLWSSLPCLCYLAHLGSAGNKPMKGNGQKTYGTQTLFYLPFLYHPHSSPHPLPHPHLPHASTHNLSLSIYKHFYMPAILVI